MADRIGVKQAMIDRTRHAAMRVAAGWALQARLGDKPRLTIDAVALNEHGSEPGEVYGLRRLRESLLHGGRFVMEGPAGCGKTTTLIQLAEGVGDATGIPLLVDLPDWATADCEILDYIAGLPDFRDCGIDAAALARVSRVESLAFLLNGWNELSETHAQNAATRLQSIARAFPSAGIIIATRTRPPLHGSKTIRLNRLTATQRLQYLEGFLGTQQAHELSSKLKGDERWTT